MTSSSEAGWGFLLHNLRYADDITLTVKNEEELKSLLKRVKKESGKAGLKLNITHYQRNANQNHYEVPFHTSQNGCDPKVYK